MILINRNDKIVILTTFNKGVTEAHLYELNGSSGLCMYNSNDNNRYDINTSFFNLIKDKILVFYDEQSSFSNIISLFGLSISVDDLRSSMLSLGVYIVDVKKCSNKYGYKKSILPIGEKKDHIHIIDFIWKNSGLIFNDCGYVKTVSVICPECSKKSPFIASKKNSSPGIILHKCVNCNKRIEISKKYFNEVKFWPSVHSDLPLTTTLLPGSISSKDREFLYSLRKIQGVNELQEKLELLMEKDIVIIDAEMSNGEIVELGVIDKNGNTLYHSIFKTIKPVSDYSYSIHGISNYESSKHPLFIDEIDKISKILSEKMIIGYSVYHDIRAINYTLSISKSKYRIRINEYIDLAAFCKLYFHKTKNIGLSYVCDKFNIDASNAHNALSDAIYTQKVLLKLLTKE